MNALSGPLTGTRTLHRMNTIPNRNDDIEVVEIGGFGRKVGNFDFSHCICFGLQKAEPRCRNSVNYMSSICPK